MNKTLFATLLVLLTSTTACLTSDEGADPYAIQLRGSDNLYRGEVERALGIWQSAVGARCSVQYYLAPYGVDGSIEVRFLTEQEWLTGFEGQDYHTSVGDTIMIRRESGAYRTSLLLQHELGHVFGLPHNLVDRDSIMAPTMFSNAVITENDVQTVWNEYGCK